MIRVILIIKKTEVEVEVHSVVEKIIGVGIRDTPHMTKTIEDGTKKIKQKQI